MQEIPNAKLFSLTQNNPTGKHYGAQNTKKAHNPISTIYNIPAAR